MPEYAKRLLVHAIAARLVEMVQCGLCAPADEHGVVHISAGPRHDLEHFLPVPHLFERDIGNGRAGDDEAVELALLHLFPGLVEAVEIFFRGVLGLVLGDAHETEIDLKRRGADQPCELGLGALLVRHQVEKAEFERTDILARGARGIHDIDALLFERLAGRQIIGNANGHGSLLIGCDRQAVQAGACSPSSGGTR